MFKFVIKNAQKYIFFYRNRSCPKFEVGINKWAFSKILFVCSTNEISFLFMIRIDNIVYEKYKCCL